MVTNNDNFVLCPQVKGNESGKQPVVSIIIIKEIYIAFSFECICKSGNIGGIVTSYLTFKALWKTPNCIP